MLICSLLFITPFLYLLLFLKKIVWVFVLCACVGVFMQSPVHDQVEYVVSPFCIIFLVNIIQEIFALTIPTTKTSFFDFNILTTLEVLDYKVSSIL
jgi:hypothetical protein